jgi:hypothetical protein
MTFEASQLGPNTDCSESSAGRTASTVIEMALFIVPTASNTGFEVKSGIGCKLLPASISIYLRIQAASTAARVSFAIHPSEYDAVITGWILIQRDVVIIKGNGASSHTSHANLTVSGYE